jgi:MFS family permease
MYGLTRATTTLIGAGAAGLLIWIATQLNHSHEGGYWGIIGLMAGAGLIMALSQLLGGWTKWGWPRLSASVLLIAFVPVAVVSLWVILAGEPQHEWFHNHVMAWTRDIHVSGLVTDMLAYIPVLAFGTGLVFGFSFDTSGPRREVPVGQRRTGATRRRTPAPADRAAADEPVTAERRATTTAPRGPVTRQREPVASGDRPVDSTHGMTDES